MKYPKSEKSKAEDIELWDNFWKEEGRIRMIEEEDSWTGLVWKVGLEFWQDIFERLAPGKKMLECGAGSAKVSFYMAKHGYDCTMIDDSPNALTAGRKNFASENSPGTFLLENVENMSFNDNTFDIVYSGGLLHHFQNVAPAVREMVRVIKPGGVFGATVITKKSSCQTIGNMEKFLAKFFLNLAKGKIKEALYKSQEEFPFYVNSIPLLKYKKILEEAGLKNVIATGTSPFPSFALPDSCHSAYARLMKRLMSFWKWFDRSDSKFTEIWGASFSLYGIKK